MHAVFRSVYHSVVVLSPICLVFVAVKDLTNEIEVLKEALGNSQLEKAEQVISLHNY